MALFAGSTRVIPVTMTNFTNNQSKSGFTPSINPIVVTPDSGYTGLSQVTIKPIPSTYVLPSLHYTVTNSGTYNISRYSTATVSSMVDPVWGTTTLNISQARLDYNISINKGFNSINQIFSSSYILPSISGSVIVPSDTSQIAIESGKWTLGSIIVDAIPNSITIYKKLYEKTIIDDEVNEYLSTQTSIPSYMFIGCNSLSSLVYGSNITSIGEFAFSGCSNLQAISFPNLSIVPYKICSTCRSLKSVYLPNAVLIGSNAFEDCYSLNTVYAPNVESLYGTAFGWCYSLTEANFPKLSYLSGGVFSYCSNLTTISFSLLSLISGGYAFYCCSRVSVFNLPILTKISGGSIFAQCSNSLFVSITLPLCSYLSNCTFISCYFLQMASFPKMETFYGSQQFQNCYRLTSLYLMNSIVATLSNSNAFSNTPIGGYSASAGTFGSIYVPSSLLTQYQTATNWSYFSNRFVGI